jgi:hypothetical protein
LGALVVLPVVPKYSRKNNALSLFSYRRMSTTLVDKEGSTASSVAQAGVRPKFVTKGT